MPIKVALSLLALVVVACAPLLDEKSMIARGQYLVKLSDCNDCHTEGFIEHGGNVPEQEWLKGSRRGWYNESGTAYATNLRLHVNQISEEEWIKTTRSMFAESPMSSSVLQEITDSDLRAVYYYLRWLGPAGEPMPRALPPGVTPPEPYLYFPPAH